MAWGLTCKVTTGTCLQVRQPFFFSLRCLHIVTCIYANTHTHAHIYKCTICASTRICTCTQIHAYVLSYIYICKHVCSIHVCPHMYMSEHTHSYMHTHIHVYKHVLMHTLHMCSHAQSGPCTCTQKCGGAQAYICVHVHKHAHAYLHTYR